MIEKGYFLGEKVTHLFNNGRRMCDGRWEDSSLLFAHKSVDVECNECRDTERGRVPNWMILDLIKASEVIKSHLHRFEIEGTNDTN